MDQGFDWQSMMGGFGGGGQGGQKPKGQGGGGFNMDYMQMIAMIGDAASKNNAQGGYAAGSGGNFYNTAAQKAQDFGDPVGAAIAGYLGGRKDKKKRKKIKKKIEAQRAIQRSIFGKGLSQQEALTRQATQQRLGGFDLAKKAAGMGAQGAKRAALEREQQLAGAVSQGLTQRGMGGTSVGANAQRGVAYDTTRALSGIDEQLAQYFGQLAMGRAGIEAGGTESLAGLAGERTGFDMQDAGFWMPYNFNQLGQIESQLAGGIRSTGDSIPMKMFGGGGNFGGQ